MKKMIYWKNRKYPGEKCAPDHKWPTMGGGVCFQLTDIVSGGKYVHYFDNWQQAYSLGWRKVVAKKKAVLIKLYEKI